MVDVPSDSTNRELQDAFNLLVAGHIEVLGNAQNKVKDKINAKAKSNPTDKVTWADLKQIMGD